MPHVTEADIKDEDSATDADSDINMSTSHSTTQRSSCSDHRSADNGRRQHTCTVCNKRLHPKSMKRHMCIHSGRQWLKGAVCKTYNPANSTWPHLRCGVGLCYSIVYCIVMDALYICASTAFL